MTEIAQRPGVLNIIYTKGDDLPIAIILGADISGHTVVANVVQSKTSTLFPITITIVHLSTGSITLKFPKASFGALAIGSHEWYLTNTDGDLNVRKWLAGLFTVVTR